MKRVYLFGLITIGTLTFTACGKKTGGCYKGEKAKVWDFTSSDTCGIVFELEDGTILEPTNLAEYSSMEFNHGDLVWVSHKPVSGASLCGMGEIVEIKCVSEREY